MVPTRDISDLLVQAYLRTFQTVLGILHVPSFRQDYNGFWRNQESANEEFLSTPILVMCIGSTFTPYETGVSRELSLQWIDAISTWLTLPKLKLVLSLGCLRIQCLFHLACQTKSIKRNKVSLSGGILLRMAMQLGLHIDPEKHSFQPMSPSDIESRR
jgi:hypothetical protein